MGNFVLCDLSLFRRADMVPLAVMHNAAQPTGLLGLVVEEVQGEGTVWGIFEQAWVQYLNAGE